MYHTSTMRTFAFLSCFLAMTALPAAAKEKSAAANLPPTVDVSAMKEKLMVLTDGKEHYVAVVPLGEAWEHLSYGDGRHFFAQRITSGSRMGDTTWERCFWDPRVDSHGRANVSFRDGTYSLQCGDRVTTLTRLDDAARDKLVAGATFHETLWQYQAYALARDSRGRYFYVDRPRVPADNKNFRLFSGLRGSLKPLKMTNIVSDSQGDIFTTRSGELRLVLDKQRSVWVERKTEQDLVQLPLLNNLQLIYQDLGVYMGQRLGTPCDDL